MPASPRPVDASLVVRSGSRETPSPGAIACGDLLDALPLLYAEPDTPPVPDHAALDGAPALLRHLLAAATPDKRREIVRDAMDALGFYALGYGRYVQSREHRRAIAHCTTYADVGWLQRYVCASYHRVDARLARVARTGLPCIWSIDSLRRASSESDDPLASAFVQDLEAAGALSGAVIAFAGTPLATPAPGAEMHVVSLASRRAGACWLDDAVLGRALMLAMCLHALYAHHLPGPGHRQTPVSLALTPMQREVLACVARGLCDKQIAARLGLSAHTIDYHLRQLRRRFDARNRVQLAQAALRAGLGAP